VDYLGRANEDDGEGNRRQPHVDATQGQGVWTRGGNLTNPNWVFGRGHRNEWFWGKGDSEREVKWRLVCLFNGKANDGGDAGNCPGDANEWKWDAGRNAWFYAVNAVLGEVRPGLMTREDNWVNADAGVAGGVAKWYNLADQVHGRPDDEHYVWNPAAPRAGGEGGAGTGLYIDLRGWSAANRRLLPGGPALWKWRKDDGGFVVVSVGNDVPAEGLPGMWVPVNYGEDFDGEPRSWPDDWVRNYAYAGAGTPLWHPFTDAPSEDNLQNPGWETALAGGAAWTWVDYLGRANENDGEGNPRLPHASATQGQGVWTRGNNLTNLDLAFGWFHRNEWFWGKGTSEGEVKWRLVCLFNGKANDGSDAGNCPGVASEWKWDAGRNAWFYTVDAAAGEVRPGLMTREDNWVNANAEVVGSVAKWYNLADQANGRPDDTHYVWSPAAPKAGEGADAGRGLYIDLRGWSVANRALLPGDPAQWQWKDSTGNRDEVPPGSEPVEGIRVDGMWVPSNFGKNHADEAADWPNYWPRDYVYAADPLWLPEALREPAPAGDPAGE
jgi:hypothetical protein